MESNQKNDFRGKWKTRDNSVAEVIEFHELHWVGKVKFNNQDIYGIWDDFGNSKVSANFDLVSRVPAQANY